ncbi:MAG: polyribonucleotide nucleotidyltransferase [Candidatus Kariarchaeaceae archaeon]
MAESLSISNIGKSEITFSTGEWAKQAGGSIRATLGNTELLATVCMSKEPAVGRDYFPLMVEYQEKTYAMGRIPGGFFKKEGRPRDKEILTARLIDRPIRPLFPKGMTNEVQVIIMVLSSDGENDPDVLAVNSSSAALMISDVPFNKAVGAVRIAKIEGQFIINPTYKEREASAMDLLVVGTDEKIIMLEGELAEVSEADTFEAIKLAHEPIKQIIQAQKDLQAKCGKAKKEVPLSIIDKDLVKTVREKVGPKLEESYIMASKEEKSALLKTIAQDLIGELVTDGSDITEGGVKSAIGEVNEEILRAKILNQGQRPDGRAIDEIRNIECKVGVLPRTHGSATFTRGQTQSLSVITLGSSADEQYIEALEGDSKKHFMLHYSFPPFSVGEVKFMRGPSRRDIGHGMLAEKSILSVLPAKEDFPYTIRVVSEILESNGSSSMATVCAASLSLMDAGVPLREPVSGIAMGLVTDGDDKFKVLTDIAGAEDHHGDMDFKVAGTKNGITAIQLDTKIDGLTFAMVEETLEKANIARAHILGKMNEAITGSRDALSDYAPKIECFPVNPEKIGAIIGPGGKMIKRIQRENEVTIDINDETNIVSVSAVTSENLAAAVKIVQSLVKDIEVGEIYEAKVEKIVDFGAFCELAPGKSGLVHVSELSDGFVKSVSDFLKEGDIVTTKVIGVDPQGKVRLSIKQAKAQEE